MGSSIGINNGPLLRETLAGAEYEETSVVCDPGGGYVLPLEALDVDVKVSTEAYPLVWEYG